MRRLIAALFIFALWGCSSYASHDVDLSGLAPEHYRAMDTRACDGLTVCGPWVRVHAATAWRDKYGELHVVAENASAADLESALGDPISKGVNMLTLPIK